MHIHKIFYIKTFKISRAHFDPKILFAHNIQLLLCCFENLILLYWFNNVTNKYILYYRHAATVPS